MLWQCRLCGSQNELTDAPCGVCGKGVYPADAAVAGAAGVAEPMGRRGVGAVITPGGAPAAPGGPAGPLPPPPAAGTPVGPAPVTARRSRRRAVIVILVLLVLIAIAVAIAIAAGSTDYGASGALASMVFLPATRRPGPVHPPAEPPAGRPAPRERGGIRAS